MNALLSYFEIARRKLTLQIGMEDIFEFFFLGFC